VPVKEHLVYDGSIYPVGSTSMFLKTTSQLNSATTTTQGTPRPCGAIQESSHKEFRDPVLNSVVALASETAMAGYGVLVFAGSRGACEADARWIGRVMPSQSEVDPAVIERRMDLILDFRALGPSMDSTLEETIPFGVAFHRVYSILSSWPCSNAN